MYTGTHSEGKKQKKDTRYAHNEAFCMIRPSAQEDDGDIVNSSGS